MPVEEGEGKEEEEDTSLANPDVTTKYQEAAKIVNSTLTEIMALVQLTFLLWCVTLTLSVFLEPMWLIFAELVIKSS